MNARLLAFDTSTEQLAVALGDGVRQWCVNEPGGAAASARLIPAIEQLLAQAGWRFQDLNGIAFGQGPGAFTGLRTSCAVAQGLALALNLPVLPLCSLMLVAEDARATATAVDGTPLQVAVAMDARMDEVYAGQFAFDAERGRWSVLDAPMLITLPALMHRWQQPLATLAGSALDAFGDRLPLQAATRVPNSHNRAAALLGLAQQQWRSGLRLAAEQALPVYLRDKVALTTEERAVARAAGAAKPTSATASATAADNPAATAADTAHPAS